MDLSAGGEASSAGGHGEPAGIIDASAKAALEPCTLMSTTSPIGTLVVGADPPIELTVNQEKWQQFVAAAELIGRPLGPLLGESVHLCMDSIVAFATHMKSED